MIYAELRREGSEDGYHTLRYLVYNGDVIGSYGVHCHPDGTPYGASRDEHRLASESNIAARKRWEEYTNLPDDQQNVIDKMGDDPPYVSSVGTCEYHDDKLAVCDGSGLVEVTQDEQRAFDIAAMMAEVSR